MRAGTAGSWELRAERDRVSQSQRSVQHFTHLGVEVEKVEVEVEHWRRRTDQPMPRVLWPRSPYFQVPLAAIDSY